MAGASVSAGCGGASAPPASAPATASEKPAEVRSGAPWSSTLRTNHPLVGRIWDPRAHAFVDRTTLEARLAGARFVLLGEKHDNPDHHRLQQELLAALVARGRRPAVIFEMVDVSDQAKIDGAGKDTEAIGASTEWDKRGWTWSLYRPLVAFAVAHDLPIVAGNFPRARIKALFHPANPPANPAVQGVPDDERERLGLSTALPEDARLSLEKELESSHCGHLPKEHLPAFVLAQRLRDGQMAERLDTRATNAPEGGAVLIAGHGHTRVDRGVPWYLRARAKTPSIATIAFFEVQPGLDAPADYAKSLGTPEALPFDAVWFTPALDDDDPCKGH